MPKLKTNRAAAKRFRITANGKVKRSQAGHRHILTKKSMKRKRAARRTEAVHTSDLNEIRALLPYGG